MIKLGFHDGSEISWLTEEDSGWFVRHFWDYSVAWFSTCTRSMVSKEKTKYSLRAQLDGRVHSVALFIKVVKLWMQQDISYVCTDHHVVTYRISTNPAINGTTIMCLYTHKQPHPFSPCNPPPFRLHPPRLILYPTPLAPAPTQSHQMDPLIQLTIPSSVYIPWSQSAYC